MVVDKSLKERSLLEGILYYLKVLLGYELLIGITTGVTCLGLGIFAFKTSSSPRESSPLPGIYTANAYLLLQKDENLVLKSLLSAMGYHLGSSTTVSYDNGKLVIAFPLNLFLL